MNTRFDYKFHITIDLKSLEEKYDAFCSLDEIAVFSSQELNTDFVGCVRDALKMHNDANYIAKFVLQHLNHYIGFCEETNDIDGLKETGELIGELVWGHGDKLEPEVKGIFEVLADEFDLVFAENAKKRSENYQNSGLDAQIKAAAEKVNEVERLKSVESGNTITGYARYFCGEFDGTVVSVDEYREISLADDPECDTVEFAPIFDGKIYDTLAESAVAQIRSFGRQIDVDNR